MSIKKNFFKCLFLNLWDKPLHLVAVRVKKFLQMCITPAFSMAFGDPHYFQLPETRNWDLSKENYFLVSNCRQTGLYNVRPKNEFLMETFGIAYCRAENFWFQGVNDARFLIDFYFAEAFAFAIFCIFLFWFSFRGRFQGVFAKKSDSRLGNIVASVISVNNVMWLYLIWAFTTTYKEFQRAKVLTVKARTVYSDPDFRYFYRPLLDYEDYNYNMSFKLFGGLFIADTFTMFMKAFFLFCLGFYLYGFARLGNIAGHPGYPETLPNLHLFFKREKFFFDNIKRLVQKQSSGYVLTDASYFYRDFFLMLPITIFFLFNLISSYNLISLFVSLEGATLCLYILAGLRVNNRLSIEAGLKYFLTSAVFSCIFGFAVFVLYLIVGSTDFYVIRETIFSILTLEESSFYLLDYALIISVLTIIIVFLMKLGAVPYHFWIGDVYQGAPLVVTTFFATMVRISFFAIFFRLVMQVFFFMQFSQVFITVLYLSAFFSIVIGSLLALVQTEIKRFLAYSSIVHTGFILIGLSAMSLEGFKSSILYTVVYIFTLLCFLVVLMMSPAQVIQNRSNSFIVNFKAIKYFADLKRLSIGRQLIFIFFLFSMAGLPPFPGFVIKLYIFKSFLLDLFYNVIQWDLMLNIETAYQFLGFFSFIIVVILSLLTGYNYIRLITSASFSKDDNKVVITDKPIVSLLNYRQRLLDNVVLFFIILLNLVLILLISKFFNSDLFDSIVSSAYHPFFNKGFVSFHSWEKLNFVGTLGRCIIEEHDVVKSFDSYTEHNPDNKERVLAEVSSYVKFFC